MEDLQILIKFYGYDKSTIELYKLVSQMYL